MKKYLLIILILLAIQGHSQVRVIDATSLLGLDTNYSKHNFILDKWWWDNISGATSSTFPGLGTDHTHAAYGDHNHSGVYEPILGNPSTNGYILSSTTEGTRSWITLPVYTNYWQLSGSDLSNVVQYGGKVTALSRTSGGSNHYYGSSIVFDGANTKATINVFGWGIGGTYTFNEGEFSGSYSSSAVTKGIDLGSSDPSDMWGSCYWGDSLWVMKYAYFPFVGPASDYDSIYVKDKITHRMKTAPRSNSMVYPGAGIPISTGSAWTTSITNNSSNWNTVIAKPDSVNVPFMKKNGNYVERDTTKKVGIGTTIPSLGKLHVVSNTSTLPAIYGKSTSSGNGVTGIGGGYGVYGYASGYTPVSGVYGESDHGNGVTAITSGGIGIYASAQTNQGGFAAQFDGRTKQYGAWYYFYNSVGTSSDSLLVKNSSTGEVKTVKNNLSLIHNAVTLGAIGSTPNANGASLTDQALNLQPANGTYGGIVSTTGQTFAGNKTFTGTPYFQSGTTWLQDPTATKGISQSIVYSNTYGNDIQTFENIITHPDNSGDTTYSIYGIKRLSSYSNGLKFTSLLKYSSNYIDKQEFTLGKVVMFSMSRFKSGTTQYNYSMPYLSTTLDGFVKYNHTGGVLSVDNSTYEPSLGNPASTGYVLSSTDAGVRSWISLGSSIANGDTIGQMLFWNGSAWVKTLAGYYKYLQSSKTISIATGFKYLWGSGTYLIDMGEGLYTNYSFMIGGNYQMWNKTFDGNIDWAVPDMSGAQTKMNLSNIGTISATNVTANLTGNVTGNTSGSSGSCTGNSATVTNGVYKTDILCYAGCGIDSTLQKTTGFNQIPAGYSVGMVVDSVIFIAIGAASPNVTLKVWYGSAPMSSGTAVVTAGTAITSVGITRVSTFNQATIAKGNAIWVTTSAVTTACARIAILIYGHRS